MLRDQQHGPEKHVHVVLVSDTSPTEKQVNQNKPIIRKVKKITRDGDLNMGTHAGVECNYEDMNKQPNNPLTQAHWGINEPVIEDCDEIGGKGKINMGTSSGITISNGKRAPK